ncbi:hypothetical protein NKY66_10685 [Sinorhizobium meliloti]|uniref:hypothetical protein n=1 Tax=Rhizobium meliloti TaxID=382 RepID=UPI003D657103
MNLRQYARLTLVSFIPLLLIGFVVATFLLPYPKFANMLCRPYFQEADCVAFTDDADYELVKKRTWAADAWFDVWTGKQEGFLGDFVEAQYRLFPEAEIAEVYFMAAPDDAASIKQSLEGKSATIHLGIPDGQRSTISAAYTKLFCNGLHFRDAVGEYMSACFGDGWSANVIYRLTGEGQQTLDHLLSAINEERAERQLEYNLYRLVTYPLFIYLFFFISFLSLLCVKAVRFVRNG